MTRRFGLIGFPLTHSFSRKYFTDIFNSEGIDAVYENYPLQSIEEVEMVFQVNGLEGINVTIPYKEQILPYLHELTNAVQEIGACNCISIRNGIRRGHNTDVIGFERTLTEGMGKHHRQALVLGTGGASKAVCYVLRKLGIWYRLVSRNGQGDVLAYEDLSMDVIQAATLIINTTPLGMFPETERFPDIPYHWIGSKHYLYDLVYNPEQTLFLKKGRERGAMVRNGAGMLTIQADESRKIWNI